MAATPSRPASGSTAWVRSTSRKYGGCLTVPEPLPCPLAFQLVDLKVLDPSELIETTLDYNTYSCRDEFYESASTPQDCQLNDPSQMVMFGRTEQGHSVCVRTNFRPYAFLYAPGLSWSTHDARSTLRTLVAKTLGLEMDDIDVEAQVVKRLDGWVPDPRDHTQTEQVSVLRLSVPNKKTFDRLIDLLDPHKSLDKLLNGTLKRLREDLLALAQYQFLTQATRDQHYKTLHNVQGRMETILKTIERAKKTDPLYQPTRIYLPTSPSPLPPPPTLACAEVKKLWQALEDKSRLIRQHMEWWQQSGYKLTGLKTTLHPVLWETSVDHVHKFCDQYRIIPSGWVELLEYHRPEGYISHAQIECVVRAQHLRPLDRPTIAPLLMASVDGEMYSPHASSFPNPLKANNPLITIGVVLCRTNSTEMERFVFCLRETDATQVTQATVFQFEDEQELLKAWRDFMTVQADPDFVVGYNILGFDWKYMAHRAAQTYRHPEVIQRITEEEEDDEEADHDDDDEGEKSTPKKPRSKKRSEEPHSKTPIVGPVGQPSRFFRLSRVWSELTPCLPKVFKSNAYGERWSYHLHMTGRAIQDLLVYIRREHKLESYKLDHVAFHFLKDRKIDLDPKLLFRYFETGPRERGLIAEYCAKDCILPIQLCQHAKLMVVQNLIEMSRVTYTTLPQIINGGQQIKVFNQLVWYAHLGGFVMNDQPPREVEGYEGATVLDPSAGWYNCPVTVLDFASLYPSIMINQNLCYSTIVREDRYKNLPGVHYNVITVGDRQHTFVQKTIQKGVLPTLEEYLLKARKAVKKQMKSEKDKDLYAMLDAKQLAIKVSCNSAYGFTGANNGMYPEPAIAESITATGRKYIERSKQYVLEHYPQADVLYGDTDSIFIKFHVPADPEGLRRSFELGREAAEAISQLFGEAMSLEMEKVYFPYLLYGKKRYIGLKYEDPEKPKGLDTKGIEIIRRDWSPLVRTIYKRCIDKVFLERDVEGSATLLRQYCQDMIDHKLDFNWFIMSKELKSQYANPDSQIHVAVVRHMAERAPGSEPQVGDRVPFVIVRQGQDYSLDPKTNKAKLRIKMSEKAEDPEYVRSRPERLDYIYYLEKQIRRPLTNFFTAFLGEPKAQGLFTDVMRQLSNDYSGLARGGLMAFLTPGPPTSCSEDGTGFAPYATAATSTASATTSAQQQQRKWQPPPSRPSIATPTQALILPPRPPPTNPVSARRRPPPASAPRSSVTNKRPKPAVSGPPQRPIDSFFQFEDE